MTRLFIKGIGAVGGFGTGVGSLEAALACKKVTVGALDVPTAQGTVSIPAYRADVSGLEEFVPKRALRRVDHFSKLGLLGAHLALKDAGLLGSNLSRLGIVVATGYGATATTFAFLDSIISDGDTCASPTHFASSVHNSAAANLSIMLGIKGPSLTVSQFEMSVPSALLSARQWLVEGRTDAILFGAIDEVSDLIGYLQHRRNGGKHVAAMAPALFNSESSIIGEGTAFLLLTRDDCGCTYCGIDDVDTGNLYGRRLFIPGDALLLLGADGRKELGRRYLETVATGANAACYTPIYGCTPAAAAFDLAAAALALRQGDPFESPVGPEPFAPGAVPLTRVCCLRFAGATEYSSVMLSTL